MRVVIKKWPGQVAKVILIIFAVLIINPSLSLAGSDSGYKELLQASAHKAQEFLQSYHREQEWEDFMGWTFLAFYGAEQSLGNLKDITDKSLAKFEQKVKTGAGFNSSITTDLDRLLLVLTAAGVDPHNFAGQNLAQSLAASQLPSGKFPDDTTYGGEDLVNAHIWSIIALQAAGIDGWDSDKAWKWLAANQNPDGGFSFMAGIPYSDVDVTASAVIALAMAGTTADDAVLKRAMEFLLSQQTQSGHFASFNEENLESTAMVIQALITAGIDPQADTLSRNGRGLVDILLSYQNEDGSFSHLPGGKGNVMATEQALLAVGDLLTGQSVYKRLMENRPKSFFVDVNPHYWAYEAIAALQQRGIMNGYPDHTFKPEQNIKRSEFARLLTVSSGEPFTDANRDTPFADVQQNHWASAEILFCHEKGWLQGADNQLFYPDRELTGAELAAVAVRLKGIASGNSEPGSQWYSSYIERAREAGLLYPDFAPEGKATRAQCAYIMWRLNSAQ